MSESGGSPGRREVAYRLFATEYDDADRSHSVSDEERAPNYVVTPTGARVNRLFVVGVLTEVESVSEDYLRARVVDPTGPFVVYAGQDQPEAMRFLEATEPPTFVAVTGKARTFQPEDSDRVYTSVRPESINEVDAETRDRWVIQAAEATLDRIARIAEARATGLAGPDLETTLLAADVEAGLANGIPTALEHYGTTGGYLEALRDVSLDALRVVAGERDEVGATLPAPDAGGDGALGELAERTLEPVTAEAEDPAEADTAEPAETGVEEGTEAARAGEEAGTEDPDDRDVGSTERTAVSSGEAATNAPGEAGQSSTAEGTEAEVADAAEASASSTVDAGSGGESETGSEPADAVESSESLGDFDLEESEREEIESEYGTEFKSATEVDEPGEADIDTPEPAEAQSGDEESPAEADGTDEIEADTTPEDEASTAEADVALDDVAMDALADMDAGDGVDRETVVGAVVERTGADPAEVEDAIQDALMDGRCYEPDDGTLKPI
jgi:RPA family protein